MEELEKRKRQPLERNPNPCLCIGNVEVSAAKICPIRASCIETGIGGAVTGPRFQGGIPS